MTPDHYATLGVPSTASAAAIRAAYLALMREYHPDRNPDPAAVERAQAIIAAFKVLGDFDRRNHHDWDRRREREAAAAVAARPQRKLGAGVIAGAIGLAAVGAWVLMRSPTPEPSRVAVAPPKEDKIEERVEKVETVKPRAKPETRKPVRLAKVEPKLAKTAKVEREPIRVAKAERPPVKVAERSVAVKPSAIRATSAKIPTPPRQARAAVKPVAKPVGTDLTPATDLASLDRAVMGFYGQSWRYGDASKRAALVQSRADFVARRGGCAADLCTRAAYLKLMRDVSEIVETGQPKTR